MQAVQLELAQSTYLATEDDPFDYDASKAERLRTVLREALHALIDTLPSTSPASDRPENLSA